MNVTDIAILLLGSYFVIRGLFRGFSGELLSLLSVIGGFYCALRFYGPISIFFSESFSITPLVTSTFAMLGIFLVIFMLCAVLDKGLKKILKGISLTWVDKFFGGIAGFLKIYVLALLLLVLGMVFSPVTGDRWVSDSKALIATAKTWPYVYPLLDRAGLLPDLATLQQEAKDYVLRQASRRLFGDEPNASQNAPLGGNAQEDDSTAPPASADTFGELQGEAVNDMLREEHGLLDFFLEWGKN